MVYIFDLDHNHSQRLIQCLFLECMSFNGIVMALLLIQQETQGFLFSLREPQGRNMRSVRWKTTFNKCLSFFSFFFFLFLSFCSVLFMCRVPAFPFSLISAGPCAAKLWWVSMSVCVCVVVQTGHETVTFCRYGLSRNMSSKQAGADIPVYKFIRSACMSMSTHTDTHISDNKKTLTAACGRRRTQKTTDKHENARREITRADTCTHTTTHTCTHMHAHIHTQGGLVHDSVIDGEKWRTQTLFFSAGCLSVCHQSQILETTGS